MTKVVIDDNESIYEGLYILNLSTEVVNWLRNETKSLGYLRHNSFNTQLPPKYPWEYQISIKNRFVSYRRKATFWFTDEQVALKFKLRWG